MSSESIVTPIEKKPEPLLLRLLKWRYVIPLMLFVGLLLSPFIYYRHLIDGIPDIGDPFDVEAFGTVVIADEDNARLDFDAAVAMLVPLPKIPGRELQGELFDAVDEGWPSATQEIRQWVEDNRPALERWKVGTDKSDFLLHQPKDLHVSLSLPQVQEIRTILHLVHLEQSRLLVEGKISDAWIWTRALFRSSRQIGFHGTGMQRMLGAIYHVSDVIHLHELAQHPAMTEELLREMLDELHRSYQKTPPKSMFVKCEYLTFKNLIHDPEMMAGFMKPGKDAKANGIHVAFVTNFGFEPRMAQLVSQHYFAHLLDQIDLPVKDRQPWTGLLEMFEPDPGRSYPTGILNPAEVDAFYMKSILARTSLSSGIRELDEACLKEETRQYALELCLALQIFHKRNGVYPDHLNSLVEAKLIDVIPIDPFSKTGAAMQYRRVGDVVIVWGVGENGSDDNGSIDRPVGKLPPDIGLRLGKEPDDSVEAKKP